MTEIPEDIRAKAESVMGQISISVNDVISHFIPCGATDLSALTPLIANALVQERERCAQIALECDGKPNRLVSDLWTQEQRDIYDAGQVDASWSIASQIRSAVKEMTTEQLREEYKR